MITVGSHCLTDGDFCEAARGGYNTVILSHFVTNSILLAVALCALATPSGNMLAMLAALYNKDSFLLATEGISLTTAVSVVTMPLVVWIVGIG